jgi:uncharacterized protein YndB with AHSA1/START domain
MSKKLIKQKTIKKAARPVKSVTKAAKKTSAPSSKTSKSSKPGKAAKLSTQSVAKKAAKNVVSKKNTIKKSSKSVAKPAKTLKKSVTKGAAKKVLKKSAKPPQKAANAEKSKSKQVKKVLKKSAPKPKASAKKLVTPKKSANATSKQVPVKAKALAKPVKKEIAKNDKPVKEEKSKDKLTVNPLKAEKPGKPVDAKPVKAEKSKPRRKKKKNKDDDDEPAIENDPLIEEIIRSTKKRSTQPKKPKIIQTFVNPMASLAVAPPAETGKKGQPKKEPKGKFELEYVVRTSAGILYEFLTSPSGLSEWFADDVNIRDGVFTFFWDGSEQKARLLSFKEDKYVRLQWIDKPEGSFFEFRIDKDDLTGDISLIIIDFADEGSDLETSKRLWDSQVNKLLHVIGSY